MVLDSKLLVLLSPILCSAIGCAHENANKVATRPTACGELVLGTPCGTGVEKQRPSRWPLWTGIATESLALVATGTGLAHWRLAEKRKEDAATATGVGEKGLLLDKAERSEDIQMWSFGIGIPLAVAGAAFIVTDWILHRKDEAETRDGRESLLRFVPTVAPTFEGGAALGAAIRW